MEFLKGRMAVGNAVQRQSTNPEHGFLHRSSNKTHKRAFDLLSPVLGEWHTAITNFCTRISEPPYYYNERANISLLAAGAWKSGCIALEEYGTNKRSISDNSSRNGRCDLWIRLQAGYEFQIEAKQKWLHAGSTSPNIRKRIKEGMAEANEEANRNTECSSRISCVFFPVSFSTKEFPDFITESDNHIKDVIKTASDNHDLVEFWIWSFPKKIRTCCKHKEQVGDNRWYPGLLTAMNAGKYFRLQNRQASARRCIKSEATSWRRRRCCSCWLSSCGSGLDGKKILADWARPPGRKVDGGTEAGTIKMIRAKGV